MKISNCQILGGEEGSRRRILKHYLLRLRGLRIQLIMK
ncbi:unnamed protein product [Paramecium sonneborni]|uniref:Uncharacterized protein n=1 Tax=Paramecium sonneborni TaxID=65129 RepID=A0A8S1MNB8_9CILI|nr:unnamed protein product [Paramecium sonneborni]